MNTEEFNRVHTITEEVKKRQAEITELIEGGNNLSDIHVARGRLIQYIKSNIKELKDLYDKYDMYMTVYDVLNNGEEKKDKINYIKNLIYKENYSPFEEKLLNIINSNIDDIDKMKKEFNDLDENNGIKELIELRETHAKELEKHRKNIDKRYRDEFLKKKTNLLSVVTMLPKAVGLACKKVATCVKEVKQAKSNKEKINKLFSVFKAAGQVVATPVIFVGKFIVDHWYLALVGLIAILKKFNILDKLFDLFKKFWFFLKGKKKKKDDKDKDKDKDGEKAEEPVAEPAAEAEEAPATLHNSAINYQTDPRFQAKPVTTPETVPHTSAINYQTDPRFQAQPQAVQQAEAATPHTSAINYQTDPRFQAQPVQVATPDPVQVVEPDFETIDVSQEEWDAMVDINNRFIDDLEWNYGYLISSRHPNVYVVGENVAPEDQVYDFVSWMNYNCPLADVNMENAEFFYLKNMTGSGSYSTKPFERNLVWPDIDPNLERGKRFFRDEKEFAEYLLSNEDPCLTEYYNRFVENNGDLSLFGKVKRLFEGSAFAEALESIGITGTGALIIFSIYEIAQYGLAPATGGLSLAAPF